ncbi:hypothetical protein BCR44DRAFT_1483917 [Catenaria anguillulae PL171]|uniref:Uncharacterized protein n=1 Tax=Catenaria anguillulae PL171 TaxID=765915 RepID=A0A1Y2HVW5_9FUNG|nr:hypothetical protein BCR44DRAFT_1483917 [Catenaria anguillulae PL171]
MVQQGKLEVLRKLKEIGVPLNVKDGLAVEVAHPPPVESETQLAKRAPGKRAAADEHGSTTSNKRLRKTLSNSSSSAAPSLHSRPFAEPSSLELDEFCSLLLTHNAPISDKALAVAIMAYPALSTASLRQRHSQSQGREDLIPLLIEYGGVPEFNQVQGIMERFFLFFRNNVDREKVARESKDARRNGRNTGHGGPILGFGEPAKRARVQEPLEQCYINKLRESS